MTAAVPTLATVWAHYDDDLIFANPTVDDAIADGHRVRSLFLTGSDAGKGVSDYATDREVGIRDAYDVMLGTKTPWTDRVTTLPSGVTLTVTAPEGDPRIALAFLRLPDGGLSGNGYPHTGRQSLARLLRGDIRSIRTLDGRQELSLDDLVAAVAEFVAGAEASQVVANMPAFAPGAEGDHPDHGSAGRIVAAAVDAGLVDGGIVRYAVGYPGAERLANLEPAVLDRKVDVFAAYAAHDSVLARDPSQYLAVRGFGAWLQRQYLVADAEVARPAVRRGWRWRRRPTTAADRGRPPRP